MNADRVLLEDISPEAAVELWWNATTRRPSQGPRKQHKKCTPRSQALEAQTSDTGSCEDDKEEDKLLLGLGRMDSGTLKQLLLIYCIQFCVIAFSDVF